MKREAAFQSELIVCLKKLFPGCIVLKNDSSYIAGIPDLTIFYNNRWAMLECKKSIKEGFRPNQIYYIEILNKMSFAAMICPENREEILNELQHAFSFGGPARLSKCK